MEGFEVIGHVGRLDEAKNQMFLLELFKDYQKINSNSKLVLVGDGELKEKIINKIEELKISDKVILLGVRKDVNKLYSMFDIFIFPSLFEGLRYCFIRSSNEWTKMFNI